MTQTLWQTGSTFNEEQYEVGTEAFKGVLSTPAPSESLGALDIQLWSVIAGIERIEKQLRQEFKFLGDARPKILRGISKLEEIAKSFEEKPL